MYRFCVWLELNVAFAPTLPRYISLNWDNTYSFAMGKQCLFSFRKIASSNNSDVGLVIFWNLDAGR